MIRRFLTPKVEEEPKPRSFDDFDLRLGDTMRGERATLGKSLLDVQRELKIKAAYIAAIENADPTAFETQGFVAGYVRSYARYLGMDPEWAYAKFCEEGNFTLAHGLSAAASAPRPGRAPAAGTSAKDGPRDPFANPNTPFSPRGERLFSRMEPGALGSLAVLVVLIAGLGYGGWSILQEIQKVRFAPVDRAPGVVAEIGQMEQPTAAIAATTEISPIAPPSADALDRLYRPQALDVPVLVARDGPISTLVPAGRAPAPSATDLAVREALAGIADPLAPVAASQGGPQVVAADIPPVVMFAVRPSWVRVKAADGTVLFEKILDAGERYVLPKTEAPPLLRAGNAGSVYFAVNGVNYGPAGVGASVVNNVALSVDGLKDKFAVADLSADKDLADYVAVAQAQGAAPAQ